MNWRSTAAKSPRRVVLDTLAKIAGSRWPIEPDFQTSKGQCGLDQHQVRRWTASRRWTILSILVHAILTVTAALARALADTVAIGRLPLRRLWSPLRKATYCRS